ncbi:MAG: GNAT family N-acetyltransferase [Gammaproteobacteria bacterium]|nr:GNAT family N-acetyltransferase [Gammaproteobacteria bacterium]
MQIMSLTGDHNRRSFDCGREELNLWLRNIAKQHQEKGLSKTFVANLEEDPARICGYYALTLAEVETTALPTSRRKKLPRVIPGVRLGRLAIDRDFQGRHLGELLLMDSIVRVGRIREHAGVVGLFVDALDESAANFYRRYGFEAFPDDHLKLFLAVR